MCGKDQQVIQKPAIGLGSPPHVRERLNLIDHDKPADRITPACAGKTDHQKTPVSSSQDHPRMCGKDTQYKQHLKDKLGSPPHVRERHLLGSLGCYGFRITPACAGKTLAVDVVVDVFKDHPRMCGKDASKREYIHGLGGSPPHVRERRWCFSLVSFYGGITPACAGKTTNGNPGTAWPWDHPRMCGKDYFVKQS